MISFTTHIIADRGITWSMRTLPSRYREIERKQDKQIKRNTKNAVADKTAKNDRVEEKRSNSLSRNYTEVNDKNKDKLNQRSISSCKIKSNAKSSSAPQPNEPNGLTYSFCSPKPAANRQAAS